MSQPAFRLASFSRPSLALGNTSTIEQYRGLSNFTSNSSSHLLPSNIPRIHVHLRSATMAAHSGAPPVNATLHLSRESDENRTHVDMPQVVNDGTADDYTTHGNGQPHERSALGDDVLSVKLILGLSRNYDHSTTGSVPNKAQKKDVDSIPNDFDDIKHLMEMPHPYTYSNSHISPNDTIELVLRSQVVLSYKYALSYQTVV